MNSTYVVVAILSQKRDPLPGDSISTTSRIEEALLRLEDVGNEIPIGKRARRRTVHDGQTGCIVVLERAEKRDVRERGERLYVESGLE